MRSEPIPNPPPPTVAGVPIDLYRSWQGKFFLGTTGDLVFGRGAGAWAELYNPPASGVNLFAWAFGVMRVTGSAYRVQIWFNAVFPGEPRLSELVSPANTALTPLPAPKVQLCYASRSEGKPEGGVKAFVRRGEAGADILSVEEGKFIFPPGGRYTIFLSNPETPEEASTGQIFFSWWEDRC